jgi:hypothetical protein
MTTTKTPYEVRHEADGLGGDYPEPMVAGRYATLEEAIAASLRFGGQSYVHHVPTGLSRHVVDEHHGPRYAMWLDSDGVD